MDKADYDTIRVLAEEHAGEIALSINDLTKSINNLAESIDESMKKHAESIDESMGKLANVITQ